MPAQGVPQRGVPEQRVKRPPLARQTNRLSDQQIDRLTHRLIHRLTHQPTHPLIHQQPIWRAIHLTQSLFWILPSPSPPLG